MRNFQAGDAAKLFVSAGLMLLAVAAAKADESSSLVTSLSSSTVSGYVDSISSSWARSDFNSSVEWMRIPPGEEIPVQVYDLIRAEVESRQAIRFGEPTLAEGSLEARERLAALVGNANHPFQSAGRRLSLDERLDGPSSVPEPHALALWLFGTAGLILWRRKARLRCFPG